MADSGFHPYHDEDYMDAMAFMNALPDQELASLLQEMEADTRQDDREICAFYLMGNCRYGEKCWNRHPQGGEKEEERDQDCAICLHKVRSAGKQFGVLMGCEHVFCLPCLREWRGRIDVPKAVSKSCPLCRTFSPYVLPSLTPIHAYTEKKGLAEGYKRNLSSIPCRHFNYGEGECPFGSSCFYDHTYRNGQKWVPPPPNFVCDEDGVWTVARKPKLSDFIHL